MGNNKYMKQMKWDCDQCHKTYKCNQSNEDKWGHEDEKVCKQVEICWNKEEKCHGHKEDHCSCKSNSNCNSCICNQLKKFEPGTLTRVFLSNGTSLTLIFVSLDPQDCCAYFFESGATSSSVIIDCNKIDAIQRNPN